VGTGPFRLTDWRRSSRIVLQRNPGYRDEVYDAHPNADDAYGQALLKRFKGRRLPMVDQVEIAIIEAEQPRWLAFLTGEQNFLERVPEQFVTQAAPGGKLAPNLAKRRIQLFREPGSDITLTVFNMDDPMVGGYSPQQVALRRAMVLADNQLREIEIGRHGQAISAQSIMPPLTTGYRSDMRTEMSLYSVPRAKALLDLYGFIDRDGDGWRERPDGQPLRLEVLTEASQSTRRLLELWKKCMDEIGVRAELKVAQWPENLKAARAGKFMMWRVGSLSATPDGQGALERAYGPSVGKANIARFRNDDFDRVYDRLKLLPDGPERLQLFDEATKLLVAYVPYRLGVHRIYTDLAYPQVVGYRHPPFWQGWWQYVDVVPP
jgi:ABC-type transport system substrate-binding protein